MTVSEQARALQASLSDRTEADLPALRSVAGAIHRLLASPTARVLRPCPRCGAAVGAREARYGHPGCPTRTRTLGS